jgi:WD40 repeat protein
MFTAFAAVSLLSLGVGSTADGTVVIRGRAPIIQALFNPDGRRLYFATHAGVEGYDVRTGRRLFDAPYGRELVCSPRGDLLAVVRVDIGMISIRGAVTVLDAATGKLLRTQTGTSAVFSPDSRWLVSHSAFNLGHPATDLPPEVQITSLRDGKTHLAQLPGAKVVRPGKPDAAGRAFHFSRDGRVLVTRARDKFGRYKTLAACELETGKALETLPGDEDLHLPRGSRYSADGKRFVDGWSVFDVQAGKAITKLELPGQANSHSWYPDFQLSADGKSVFGSSSGRRDVGVDDEGGRTTVRMTSHLHLWDADTGKWQRSLADATRVLTLPTVTFKQLGNFPHGAPRFAVNPQGTLAVDYDERAVTVWDLGTGKPLRKMRAAGPSAHPEVLRFSPDGKWLVSASISGEVALWDARTGRPGPALDLAAHVGDVCFRPKSNELLGAGAGLVYAWDLRTGRLGRTFEHKANLFRVACYPAGKLAAVSDHWSESVTLLDTETGKTVHRLPGKARLLAFHPDDGSLVSVDSGGTVTFWDPASGKDLKRWPAGNGGSKPYPPLRVAFVPGAARLFLCEYDAVAVLDAATGKRVTEHRFKKHPSDADVHPDGKRFVVAFPGDSEIEERNLETGKVLRTYPGYLHGTLQARYSLDGSRLATAGAYAFEVRLHSVPTRGD